MIGKIPDGILHITFRCEVDDRLLPYDIPDSALSVSFMNKITNLGDNILPHGLEYLHIEYAPGVNISPNALPSTLRHMKICCKNIGVNRLKLPENLVTLRLSQWTSDNNIIIPRGLRFLKICRSYGGINNTSIGECLSTLDRLIIDNNRVATALDIRDTRLTYIDIQTRQMMKWNDFPKTVRVLKTYAHQKEFRNDLDLEALEIVGNGIRYIESNTMVKLRIWDHSVECRLGHMPKLEILDAYCNVTYEIKYVPMLKMLACNNLTLDDITPNLIGVGINDENYTEDMLTGLPSNIIYYKGGLFDILSNHIEIADVYDDMTSMPLSNIRVILDTKWEAYYGRSLCFCRHSEKYHDGMNRVGHEPGRYYSYEPLVPEYLPSNLHIEELDHVALGLSKHIPGIYLYEINIKPRRPMKSATK